MRIIYYGLAGIVLAGTLLATAGGVAFAAPERSERARVAGVVQEEHGHTLVVRTRGGETVDVHWSDQTHCRVEGAGDNCEAIEPGYGVVAVGRQLGNDNFQAKGIAAKPLVHQQRERIAGLVRAEHDHTLEVRTRDAGLVHVHWSDETTCRIAQAEADCEAIEPGYHVLAIGQRLGDSFEAKVIAAKPGPAVIAAP